MNPTTSHSSPYKLILIVIGVVVSLHVLTAMALVMIKPQSVPVKPLEADEVTPIEIELIPPPVDIKEMTVAKEQAEPVKEGKVQPKAKPVAAAKPQIVEKSKPTNKLKPKTKEDTPSAQKEATKPKDQVVKEQTTVTQQPTKKQLTQVANTPTEVELTSKLRDPQRQKILVANANAQAALREENLRKQRALAQAQKAAQDKASAAKEAQKRAAKRQAQAAAQAEAKTEQEARAAEALAAQQAAKRALEQAALQQAVKEAAAQVASNESVDFSESDASWAVTPSISFPERAKRGARSGDIFTVQLLLKVNKQGSIDSVRLAKSSGNAVLDREAQRQVKSGKFKPFVQNGRPVVGNVVLPLTYKMP